MNDVVPATLNEAIATQPAWLQLWVLALVGTHLGAVLFVITRRNGKFSLRPEAIAIVLSFVAAGAAMQWLYQQLGYVRLLGLPHLVFWLPVYIWLLTKFRKGAFVSPFRQYLLVYFVIAGLSLLVDFVDVVRYLIGER